MIITQVVAYFVAVFMGLNIGGNNAAAAMGAAYGAKVRTKYQAVILIGVFSLIGAVIGDGAVIKTLGSGILADHSKFEASIKKLLNLLLTISGCYVAYSAGANNAANAVGPFVGAVSSIPFVALPLVV
jgi:phosphate/sulfate permease